MLRIITPVIFLVCLLGVSTFLHAQADQEPDYFFAHSHEFADALSELNREIAAVEIAEDMVIIGHWLTLKNKTKRALCEGRQN